MSKGTEEEIIIDFGKMARNFCFPEVIQGFDGVCRFVLHEHQNYFKPEMKLSIKLATLSGCSRQIAPALSSTTW